jgi:thioredoxin 1
MTTLTDANFPKEIGQSKGVALVDFFALWCGPCKIISPIVDELSHDFSGKATFGKIDVDENQTTAMQFQVMSIPTLVFYKDGKEIDRVIGAVSKDSLKQKLEQLVDA